jgi:hypothetical protein
LNPLILFIDATSRLLRNLNDRKFKAWFENFMFDTQLGFNIFPFPIFCVVLYQT